MSDGETITLPVLPLRDIVVFPNMIVRLFVGREKSVKALEYFSPIKLHAKWDFVKLV